MGARLGRSRRITPVRRAWVPTRTAVVARAPTATTSPATSVTDTGATLNGTVVPNNAATTYQFEYGPTIAYGTRIPLVAEAVGSDGATYALSQAITGLTAETVYHYRIVATNSAGTTNGADETFATEAAPDGPPVASSVAGAGAPEQLAHQTSTVRVRHVTMCDADDLGAVEVLGKYFRGDWGMNGELGWQKGSYSLRIGEEGDFTLELPNAVGSDGRLHRDRLAITRAGRARPLPGGILEYSGGAYRPGDEWFEIYEGNSSTPEYVGTPTKATVTKQRITVTGWDGFWRLKKTREFQAGFWHHSPRDVIEHYTGLWVCSYADNMGTTNANRRHARGTTFAGNVATLTEAGGLDAQVGSNGQPVTNGPARLEGVLQYTRGTTGLITYLRLGPCYIGIDIGDGAVSCAVDDSGGSLLWIRPGTAVSPDVDIALAIEIRYGWVYYYVNGTLVQLLPVPETNPANVGVIVGTMGTARVRSLIYRHHEPFLLRGSDKGDYRLPGAPTPGGLFAQYYDGADELAKYAASLAYSLMLAPAKEPVATRVDAFLGDFTTTARPPLWPAVDLQTNFGVRWSGSINMGAGSNLRLDQFADVRLRVAADDLVNVWVGKTTGSPLLTAGTGGGFATSGSLNAHLDDGPGGWYPIVIEYTQATDGGGLIIEFSNDGGRTWAGQAGISFSPYGVALDQVRNDSHYDTLKAIADSYGYQITCEPRSLESGEFPGQLVPRLRQGRDTAKVVDEPRAWNLSDSIDSEGVADAWMADAAGIADPNGTAQLTAEIVNYDQATEHLGLLTEYESLAEISQKPMLEQRLQSLLALSAAPWEEVSIDADGFRELIDVWPLPASSESDPRLFAWQPGDGVRLNAPSLGVIDPSPRQIMGITRDFNPDDLKPPRAAFRQRPRDFAAVIRQLKRQALLPQRNYQGTLVERGGTAGGSPSTYSIVLGPANPADIARARLIVRDKSDASPWNVDVGGVVRFAVTTNGEYDVTPYVGGGRQFARLLSQGAGSTGSWQCCLVLTIRI